MYVHVLQSCITGAPLELVATSNYDANIYNTIACVCICYMYSKSCHAWLHDCDVKNPKIRWTDIDHLASRWKRQHGLAMTRSNEVEIM